MNTEVAHIFMSSCLWDVCVESRASYIYTLKSQLIKWKKFLPMMFEITAAHRVSSKGICMSTWPSTLAIAC